MTAHDLTYYSSDILQDSTPYANNYEQYPITNQSDQQYNPSRGQYPQHQQYNNRYRGNTMTEIQSNDNANASTKWTRGYKKQRTSHDNSKSFDDGFRSGISKRGGSKQRRFGGGSRNRNSGRRSGRGGGRGRGFGGRRQGNRGRRGRGRGRGNRRGSGGRKSMTEEDLDKELDGYLYGGDDGEELRKKALDDDLDSYFAEAAFKEIDTNGDGKIDADEVAAALHKKVEPIPEKTEENGAKTDEKATK